MAQWLNKPTNTIRDITARRMGPRVRGDDDLL